MISFFYFIFDLLALSGPDKINCDTSYPWQAYFQDGSTPTFQGIVELHDTIFFYLIIISFLVFWIFTSVLMNFNSNKTGIIHKYHNHGTLIELVWTITPAFVLIAIAFPSFKLLYLMDEVSDPGMTIKVLGNQWYWSYEYSDFINDKGESIEFDVRGERPSCYGSKRSIHYHYMDATIHLANEENSLVNIACEVKANYEQNQFTLYNPQVASPMIKATLLESNHLETSINKYCHYWDGTFSMSLPLSQRGIEVINATQTVGNGLNDESLVSKGEDWTRCVTVGLPKGWKTHGNGVSIVPIVMRISAQYVRGNALRKGRDTVNNMFQFRNNSTGGTTQTSNVVDKLNSLRLRSKDSHTIDRNLISLLSNYDLLELAYNNIKSKPGNMTAGINPETLDGMNADWFKTTAELIRSGQFKFQPSRRINIPKAYGGTRSLSIGSPRDKVVQEGMRMILDAIYDPTFSNNSHGFRPFRSCHTALKAYFTNFKHTQWLIEGDISKCFDSIEHKKLMNLIEERISDRRFTHYINKVLKAGFFEFQTYKHNIAGTPQGSIISPVLANIFLHQLDTFVESLKKDFDKGDKPKRSKIARHFENKIVRAKSKGDMKLVRTLTLLARNYTFMDFEDPNFRRLMYLRYADDWIIGIRGTAQDAKNLLAKVSDYCNSIGLKMNLEKTKITNLRTSKALFLGVELSRTNTTKFTKVKSSSSTRRLPLNLRMTAPIARIIKKLSDTGFIINYKPVPKFLWLHNSHDQIIYLYNSVMRGFLNYYSFVHNYSRVVSLLNFILKQSAAKLLAAKFKLGTRAKVFKKLGPDLTTPNKVNFLKASYKSNYLNFKVNRIDIQTLENIQGLYVSNKSLASLHQKVCNICGSNYRVEMHHVRKMSDLNPKIHLLDKLMIKTHRKQIPLCRECHMKKHHGDKSI